MVQLVEYRTRNQEVAGSTHTQSTAGNLKQVANLLCAQANSASYPQWDGKWVVATATGWRPSVADWAMVCLLAAPWVQLYVSAGSGWPHNALRHHWLMPIICHFWDCKALLVTSLTHVNGAVASVQTFTFNFSSALQRVTKYMHKITWKHAKSKLVTLQCYSLVQPWLHSGCIQRCRNVSAHEKLSHTKIYASGSGCHHWCAICSPHVKLHQSTL